MPALARDFTVIAVDQRGIGLSDKPADGYDTGTLASDLVGLMDALGHERFAVVGHDTGFAISYALAADHPDRVDACGARRDPRTPAGDALPAAVRARRRSTTGSGTSRSTGSRSCPSSSIKGREDVFFGYEFAIQGGKLPDDAIAYYVAPALRPRRPCAAASGSTGHWTRPWPRTTERGEPGADDARPGDRRRGKLRRSTSATRCRPLADDVQTRRHRRRRPLGRRGGTRRDAGRADHVPGPVPGRRPPRTRRARRRAGALGELCSSVAHMPSLDGATEWLNSEPLGPAELRGHVVLVNFWTLTCINWLRQEPYVRAWVEGLPRRRAGRHRRPHPGVLLRARRRPRCGARPMARAIDYPVVVDNDYGVWSAFDNHYWPALYFVDRGRRHPRPALRRGALRAVGASHPAAARHRSRARRRRGDRRGGGGRLGPPAHSRDLPRLRTRRALRVSAGRVDQRTAHVRPARAPGHQPLGPGRHMDDRTRERRARPGRRQHRLPLPRARRPPRPVARGVRADPLPRAARRSGSRLLTRCRHDEDGNGTLRHGRLHQLIRQADGVRERTLTITFSEPGAQAYVFTFG